MEKQTNKHYLTNKEIREIAKENLRQMKKYEKAKKAKLPDTILEIDNLHTYFFTESGVSKAVNGVSFDIPQGSVVGVVGESGCGKSVTSLAIMRLVQGPQGQIVNGSIRFKSTALVTGEDGKPVPRGLQRRAHARGPGPDNDDIPLRTHHLFSSVLKEGAPDCRFTDMPSRTGMRQDCWFGTPSISMRHS